MATTVTVTDVQTDPTLGLVTITAEFTSNGRTWTQGFTFNPSITSYYTTAQEYVDLVKLTLTNHVNDVAANRRQLDAKTNMWQYTNAVKAITFTTDT